MGSIEFTLRNRVKQSVKLGFGPGLLGFWGRFRAMGPNVAPQKPINPLHSTQPAMNRRRYAARLQSMKLGPYTTALSMSTSD